MALLAAERRIKEQKIREQKEKRSALQSSQNPDDLDNIQPDEQIQSGGNEQLLIEEESQSDSTQNVILELSQVLQQF